MTSPKTSAFEQFRNHSRRSWNNIQKAKAKSADIQRTISNAISKKKTLLFNPSDVSLVVFGSIARNECTDDSDVDWTLLVDGQTNSDHLKISKEIRSRLDAKKLKQPSAGGSFGSIAFSHELVHHIGGEKDTNLNMTRRVLLLLESMPIQAAPVRGATSQTKTNDAYRRVVTAVLKRYLEADSGFSSPGIHRSRVPRFLLNGIVRFWRTLCVDFAWKEWEQSEDKWALRNVKLRMSRKLIFVKGLLMAFSCYKNRDLALSDKDERINSYLSHLTDYIYMTPLDTVCDVLPKHFGRHKIAAILDSYDEFLGMLNNQQIREKLSRMRSGEAYGDKTFRRARSLSHEFQRALDSVFFEKNSMLCEFTTKLGVF